MNPPYEVSAPVHAAAAAVRELVDSGWVLRQWQRGTDLSEAHVEHRPGTLTVQGGWWYRGELSVAETPGGTLLVRRVSNVARQGRWMVPLANRLFIGYRGRIQRGIDDLSVASNHCRSTGVLQGRRRGEVPAPSIRTVPPLKTAADRF